MTGKTAISSCWQEMDDAEAWDRMLADLDGHSLQSTRWREARRKVDGYASHCFICDVGNIKMDFVGRMENIQEDFSYVCQKINNNATLPVVNKTRSDHYSNYFNATTRKLVYKVYGKDIKLFGYNFMQ